MTTDRPKFRPRVDSSRLGRSPLLTADDHRSSRRNRILLLAQMRVDGETTKFDIRIRDLSAGGLRAQFAGCQLNGTRIAVEIRNIGWVKGRVVWQDDAHLGVRCDSPIDPDKARIAVTGNYASPPPLTRVAQRRL